MDRNSAQANKKARSYAALSDLSRKRVRPLFEQCARCARISIFWPELSSGVSDSARSLRYATGNLPRLDGEKTVESLVDGISNLIGFCLVLGSMLGLYTAPLIIAMVRDHHRLPWIGLLNIAAGWTIVGWIAALVWSVTAIRQPEAIMRIGSTALRTAQPAAP